MKRSLLVLLLLCSVHVLFAQEDEEPAQKGFQRDKVFVGGNFGLSFGNYTLINVSPQVGYRFNKYLAAGMGMNFQYVSLKEKDAYNDPYRKTSQGVVGLNVFGRVYPIRQFMLQVQPEVNYLFGKEKYYERSYQPAQTYNLNTEIVPSVLAGGGLVLPSGRGAMIISVFYDVLQNKSSPYGNKAIVNFTFNVGL